MRIYFLCFARWIFKKCPKILEICNANVKHNWKTQTLKSSWKIGTHFGTLSRQVEKLACFWHVGTSNWIIGTPLTRCHVYWHFDMWAGKNEKLACFWQADTLAYWHVDHGGSHGTHCTRFSKLPLIYCLRSMQHKFCGAQFFIFFWHR